MIPRLFRFYAPPLHDRPLSRCPRAGSHCVSNRQTLLFLDKKLSSETLQPARGSDRKRPGNHCHRPIKTNRPYQRATLTRPNRPSDSAKEPERPVQRASFSPRSARLTISSSLPVMSRKVNPLNVRGLETSLKCACAQPRKHHRKISQAQGAKTDK